MLTAIGKVFCIEWDQKRLAVVAPEIIVSCTNLLKHVIKIEVSKCCSSYLNEKIFRVFRHENGLVHYHNRRCSL